MEVSEAAEYIGNLDPNAQRVALESIKYDNPDMYQELNTLLQGSSKK
jgi:hypothetical protein